MTMRAQGSLAATAFALSGILALNACASPAKQAASAPRNQAETARAEVVKGVDPMKLQSGLLALADTGVSRIASATATEGRKLDPDARLRANANRLALSSAMFGIVTGPDQVDALLDVLTHTALVAEAQRNAAQGAPAGSLDAELRVALDRNEADAWKLSEQWLTRPMRDGLRARIAALPLDRSAPAKVAYVKLADLPRAGSASIDSGDGISDSLRAATQQADQVRLLAERSLFLMQRMPFLMRWQAQAYSYDTLALDETKLLLKQMGDLSIAAADAARVAAQMPGTISKERQAALADLFERIRAEREAAILQLAAAVREERSAALRQTSDIIEAQRKGTLEDVMKIANEAETRGTRLTGAALAFVGLLIVLVLGLLLIYRRLTQRLDEHAKARLPGA